MSDSVWIKTVEGVSLIDRDKVRQALSLLIDPDATHEVRGVPSGASAVVRGSDLDAAVNAVERLGGNRGIYLTLNPVRPDLNGSASADDIVCRRHLLIDCDRHHAKDKNATDDEKAAAKAVADSVEADLTARGWPRPMVVDSGNGWHLIYAVDLPNDKLSYVTIKRFLEAVDALHGTEDAGVDTVVHDAPRISKIPGTWVRKGPEEPGRPHRLARLVSVPTAITPVPFELIQDYAGLGPKSEPPEAPDAWAMPVIRSNQDRSGYARMALKLECGEVEKAPEGQRNNRLNLAAFRVGQLLHLGLLRPDAESSLATAARSVGLPDGEARKTIRSGLNAGSDHPREPRNRGESAASARQVAPVAYGGSHEVERLEPTVGKSGRKYAYPLIVKGTDVKPEAIHWLMPNRIPYGFLTLFAGKTSVGKSFVTLDIVARLSVGGEIPNGGGECFDQQSSLIISEDSHKHILAPRLIEAKADMSKINFMSWHAMSGFTLADTQMLDDTYHAAGQPRMIVIDPPTNFLGGSDEHKNAEVRGVLMGVSIWCMSYDAACVMITHCNKGVKKDMAALDRIIGSVAWASTSRIAHVMDKHPDERSQRVFVPIKSNIGEMPVGLVYQIKKSGSLAVVDWCGTIDIDADDVMSGEKKKPRGVVATEWLAERFREKREWLSSDLIASGKEAGVSRDALFSPQVAALPIVKRQHIYANGERHWAWVAKEGWPPENARDSATLQLCPPKSNQDNTNNRVAMGEGGANPESETQDCRVAESQRNEGQTVPAKEGQAKRAEQAKRRDARRADAGRFLVEVLGDGPMKHNDVAAAVAFYGKVQWKDVEKAAEFLSVVQKIEDGQMFWSLPK